jgi:Chemotaxis protein histidine kinase and related kinases
MNLVGELVIARSRLDERFAQIERVNELLAFSRSRMSQAVRDFEEKHRYTQLPPALSGAGADPGSDVFAELEFDRYDDFNIFARSVDEISADVSEIQAQLAGFIRSVGEDTAQLHRLTGSLRGEVTRARMVPIGRLFSRFLQPVREAARAGGKSLELQLAGETVEVDNAVIEQIADPLLHLVRNAWITASRARRSAAPRASPRAPPSRSARITRGASFTSRWRTTGAAWTPPACGSARRGWASCRRPPPRPSTRARRSI